MAYHRGNSEQQIAEDKDVHAGQVGDLWLEVRRLDL
eukprot:COSAG05_NODE_5275_length_1217_cov_1.924866_2_plen_36_part_00